MTELFAIVLTLLALGLLVPAAVLVVECLASLLPARPTQRLQGSRPSVAVIVPAHNEAERIDTCLRALGPQLGSGDRIIVVADNCVDETATRALERGATVLERNEAERPGKGYAILHALDAIAASPPDVVVLIDADSVAQDGLVDTLARAAARTRGPVQAAYLSELPPQPGALDRVSALAFVAKNLTRPRGLARMGLPCLLTGTGTAFPWRVIREAPISGAKTAEDMRLAIDLSIAGHPPTLCPEARVSGPLRKWDDGVPLQRTRWEHGHLDTLFDRVFPLLRAAFRQRRLSLLALALELSVPPLSLWVLLLTIVGSLSVALTLMGGSSLPLVLVFVEGLLVAASVFVAWVHDARDLVSGRALLAAGSYVMQKVPAYTSFLRRPQTHWALAMAPARDSTALAGIAERADPDPRIVEIGSCRFHALSEAALVRRVIERLDVGQGGWILTLNLDHLWHLARNMEYAALCARGTFVVADGMPLVWTSRLQGTPLPERVAGSDLIGSLTAAAAMHDKSIFLIGGMPGDAEGAAAALRARHPELHVAGVRGAAVPGFDDLANDLRGTQPDIVYVSLGKIAEERLIVRLRESSPHAWFIGVGTSFGFLSGRVRRAPPLIRNLGLEWAYRWTQEPSRLTGRYLRCIPLAIRLLGNAATTRARQAAHLE